MGCLKKYYFFLKILYLLNLNRFSMILVTNIAYLMMKIFIRRHFFWLYLNSLIFLEKKDATELL